MENALSVPEQFQRNFFSATIQMYCTIQSTTLEFRTKVYLGNLYLTDYSEMKSQKLENHQILGIHCWRNARELAAA